MDHCLMRTVNVTWPPERVENGDRGGAGLPRLFVGSLAALAPLVSRNDYRQVLRGSAENRPCTIFRLIPPAFIMLKPFFSLALFPIRAIDRNKVSGSTAF